MLSMALISSASTAGSYYSQDNYYAAEDKLGQSEWGGAAAQELGLEGAVEEKDFEQILEAACPMAKPSAVARRSIDPDLILPFPPRSPSR